MNNKPASTPKGISPSKDAPSIFRLRHHKRRIQGFFTHQIWKPLNFLIWRPFKRFFWKPLKRLTESLFNIAEWILQIPIGFISVFLIKPARIDILVAAYILFGKSRVEFLSATLGVVGIVVALLEKPVPGLVLALGGLLGVAVILYILNEAPTIRWHFLSHSISIEYEDQNTIIYKEEVEARSLKFNNNELEFSFDFDGQVYIEKVQVTINSQEKTELFSGGRHMLNCFYLEKPQGQGKNKIFVKPDRLIKFAEELRVSVELRVNNAKESQQRYTVRTLVDELSFKLAFPANGTWKELENVRVDPFEEFGVGEDSKRTKRNFVRAIRIIREKNYPDRFYITYKVRYPKYLHRYGIEWKPSSQ